MSLYKTFKTSEDLEKTGIYVQYGFVNDDPDRPIRILIARAGGGNVKFARVLEAKMKPHRRAIQTETIDSKLADRLFMEVYAESVLLGWENVQDEEGNDLPFSVANAIKIMTELPDLYRDLREQAGKAVLFRQDILETDAKN